MAEKSAPPAVRRHRTDIQGLRAVAVLLVVLYHANVPGVTGGYVGVDVFFVISGYLITSALSAEAERDGRISFGRFYGRRMRRLLPAAVIVMVFSVVMARVFLPVTQAQSVMTDVFYAAVYGINYHLAFEGVQYQNATAPPSPLQHFWSLSVEEQFYVVWPLLIALCLLVGRRRHFRRLMVGAIALISAGTFLASVVQTPQDTSLSYFSIHTRAWELGAGALLALLAHRLVMPQGVRAVLAWSGTAAIVATAFLYTDRTLYPGWAAAVPVAGAAALLAAGTLGEVPSLQRVLGHGAMQYMGKVSYAWYLWHWPMLILLPAWVGGELGWGYQVEIVFLAFWAAVLTYFLENAAARHSLTLRGWLAAGTAMSAVAAGTAFVLLLSLPNLVGTGEARQAVALRTADLTEVSRTIDASAGITALPSNLTPALGVARDDLPSSSADGCHLDFLETEQGECLFGDPQGARTMVLIGDSHAQQWLAPLEEQARANGYRLYSFTKSACPIAQMGPVYSDQLKRTYTECSTWRAAIQERVRTLDPDLIVSSQSDQVVWSSMTDDEWGQATVDGLRAMAGADSRIVYMQDTPYVGDDPLACLQEHLADASQCAVPVSGAFAFFPDRHTAVHAAVDRAGYQFVDTLPFFCTQTCPAVVENMTVRRDNGHVTNTYAAWLAPMLAPLFEEL
ncbi:acyltransferase family protein [Modestobacter sp. L9-4]|uniref:acyltransferase family protein n=1 Tax=Modestobacter sp. L9-4 TaxID=2851567 RepID=UPI002107A4D4|nr:acyltransferase family protein [Modestobacter sp. L9-4]